MATKATIQRVDGKSSLPKGLRFQLYKSVLGTKAIADVCRLPSKPTNLQSLDLALEVAHGTGPTWVAVDQDGARHVEDRQQATFGLAAVQRGFATKLALIALAEEILLNGTHALSLAVLDTKDSIFVPKVGLLLYLTERFRPFVGSPDEESGLLGLECPCCSIEIQCQPSTYVVTCRCGAVYHHETKETHPDLDPKERLNCLNKIKHCLRCKQELSTEEALVWDPSTF